MISIIVPTLNEEKVIESTLVSLRSMKAHDYEIIVADGGSTDKTLEIAGRLASKVVHQSKERRFIAGGRNVGAEASTGELLVFFDADCTIPNMDEFFAEALEHFKNPKLVALCPRIVVWPNMATWADRTSFFIANVYGFILNNVFHFGAAMGEFQMVRRVAYERVRGYNENIAVGEDQDFFKRISRAGRTKLIWKLKVFHTSRRAHAIGWTKLWWLWLTNGIYMHFFSRSISKEWEVIR